MSTIKRNRIVRMLSVLVCMLIAVSIFCLTVFASEAETDAKEDDKSAERYPSYSYTISTAETDENGKVIFVGTVGGSLETDSDGKLVYIMNGVPLDQLGVAVQGQISTVEKNRTPAMVYVLGSLCVVCFCVIGVLVYLLQRKKKVRPRTAEEMAWESKSRHD